MKKIICFFLFVFLLACNGRKESINKEQSDNNATITKVEKQYPQFDDPFLKTVSILLPDELNKRIGKAYPENVSDFFLLMPDTISMSYTSKQRAAMLKGKVISNMSIQACDNIHGFLSLDNLDGVMWAMFVQKVDDEIRESLLSEKNTGPTWEILVYASECNLPCFTTQASRYYYNNGHLVEYTAAMLNGYQDYTLDMFLQRDRFSDEEWEKLEDRFAERGRANIFFALPRDGKNMEMYIDPLLFEDFDIPREYFKVVVTDVSQ